MADTPSATVLDSSCWIEFFLGSDAAKSYSPIVSSTRLIVPSITIFEVSRELLRRFGNEHTLRAISLMQQHQVVPLTSDVALNAAQIAINLNLSSADAIVYATAWQHRAWLYTHDSDLNGLENVIYLSRQ